MRVVRVKAAAPPTGFDTLPRHIRASGDGASPLLWAAGRGAPVPVRTQGWQPSFISKNAVSLFSVYGGDDGRGNIAQSEGFEFLPTFFLIKKIVYSDHLSHLQQKQQQKVTLI